MSVVVVFLGARAVRDRTHGDHADHQDDDRLTDQLGRGGDAQPCAEGGDPGAEGRASRPGGVHQREQRATGERLDRRALDVRHDVERADPGTGDDEPDARERHGVQRSGDADECQCGRDQDGDRRQGTSAAQAPEQRGGAEQAADRADRDTAEHETDGADVDTELDAELREPGAPAGQADPADGERDDDRVPPPGELAAVHVDPGGVHPAIEPA
ncbi:hypothetical protein QP157_03640 [Sphingomonas sp. LR61]|uniref:hypothetical protein n=1 Tax=Sphingomonas sp. LR61 TaxID=3050234 RepID=UPI002FDF201F